jgi:hypothetical protein
LTLLAPDILEAILVGQRSELIVPKLTAPLPVGWERQRAMMSCRGALLDVKPVMTPAGLAPVAWLHGASAALPGME